MAGSETAMQAVTFQLGVDNYGIDIMSVQEIVDCNEIRRIPHVPDYIEGLYNLRGDILPIINLHKRFDLKKAKDIQNDSLLILNMGDVQFGIIIDKVLRVISINTDEIQNPPQMLSGIGVEYIQGVVHQEDGYLILLDCSHLFQQDELSKINHYS